MLEKKYIWKKYGLSSYDAEQLVSSKEVANYFEEGGAKTAKSTKTLANLLISEIFRLTGAEEFQVPFPPEYLSELVNLIEDGTVNSSTSKKIIEDMWKNPKSPKEIVKEKGLEQINNIEILSPIIDEVIAKNQRAVSEYIDGNEKALQSIIGQVMGRTKGKANPQLTIKVIKDKLNK